jgi:hypothetical protein
MSKKWSDDELEAVRDEWKAKYEKLAAGDAERRKWLEKARADREAVRVTMKNQQREWTQEQVEAVIAEVPPWAGEGHYAELILDARAERDALSQDSRIFENERLRQKFDKIPYRAAKSGLFVTDLWEMLDAAIRGEK